MRRFFLVFSVFISVFTQAETITPNITNPNVLFIVVTSNIMSSRYEDIIKGIAASANNNTFKSLRTGLITVRNCGKGTATYDVPLGLNNVANIANALKKIKLEGTHEDLVEAMTLAKGIVKEQLDKNLGGTDIVLYAQTSCACTSTDKHLQILAEIKEMCKNMKKTINIDVVTSTTHGDIQAFFDEVVEITGGTVHNVRGLQEEKDALSEIIRRKENSRPALPPQSKINKENQKPDQKKDNSKTEKEKPKDKVKESEKNKQDQKKD
jgi:hypothetical protein